MIYIISLFRRLKFKSSFYFSLPLALLLTLAFPRWETFVLAIPSITFVLMCLSNFVNYLDRKKKTNIKCKLCSYDHCVLLYPAKKRTKEAEKGSYACSSFDHGHYPNIYFCPICKNGFLESVCDWAFEQTVKDGHKLYEDVEDTTYIENIEPRYETYRKLVPKYREYFAGKDILEIGSYYGVFYEVVHKEAKQYLGIEPSKHACDYLRSKHPGIDLINNNLEDAIAQGMLTNKKFDTIVMWDVIEHLPDPIKTLRDLNPLLKEGGHVIFSTINIEASISLLLGPFWPWFMDMHYYYFSDRGYVDMLQRSGHVHMKQAHFKYYVFLSYFINKVGSLLYYRFSLPEKLSKKLDIAIPIVLGDTVMVIGKKESK